MFLGVRQDIWIIMLLCVLIVFLYSVIGDLAAAKKNSERASRFQPMKYAAIALCAVIAVVATVISKHEVYIGSPMLALIIGIVIVNLIPDEKFSKSFQAGTSYAGKKYLNLGIIALGATLAFTDIFSAVYALPLVLFNMILAFSMANLVGRKVLKVSPNTCTLVGGGTCICGGTAIAALSPIIKAKEEETAYAMTSIFLFDLLACLSYPYLAMNLGFSETQFGFLAGTAINDTSSVVAAQETFSGLMNNRVCAASFDQGSTDLYDHRTGADFLSDHHPARCGIRFWFVRLRGARGLEGVPQIHSVLFGRCGAEYGTCERGGGRGVIYRLLFSVLCQRL